MSTPGRNERDIVLGNTVLIILKKLKSTMSMANWYSNTHPSMWRVCYLLPHSCVINQALLHGNLLKSRGYNSIINEWKITLIACDPLPSPKERSKDTSPNDVKIHVCVTSQNQNLGIYRKQSGEAMLRVSFHNLSSFLDHVITCKNQVTYGFPWLVNKVRPFRATYRSFCRHRR